MQPHIIALLVFGCLTSGFIGAFIGAKVRAARENKTVEALVGQLRTHIQALSEILATKNTELERLSVQAADEHRRRVETVEMIAVTERDRNQWKEMYWKASLGHSAAQELLMNRIGLLHSVLTRHGIKIPRNFKDCEDAVNKFRADHGPKKSDGDSTGGRIAIQPTESVESPKC